MTRQQKGFEESIVCNVENRCEKPEKLKTKPQECTPEQVKECHGDVEVHPCVEEKDPESQ